jgi:hypothetical protein
MSAWAIDSKVLFDPSIDFFARVVSEDGETYEFVLNDTNDILEGIKAADAEAAKDVEGLNVANVVEATAGPIDKITEEGAAT